MRCLIFSQWRDSRTGVMCEYLWCVSDSASKASGCMVTERRHYDGRHRGPRATSVRENVWNNSKKRKKSCFLYFQKNVKIRSIIFHGCLIMFIVPVHCCQNLTLPNVPTRCSAMAQNGSHSRIWEMNYSDHWAKYIYVNSFRWIED